MTLTNSTISGNYAGYGGFVYGPFFGGGGNLGAYGDGGGIFANSGAVTLTNSTVSGNGVNRFGNGFSGGITAGSGSVFLNNSTISENSGTGIRASSGNVSLTNSTISGNSNDGIRAGNVYLTNSTITNNSTGVVVGNSSVVINNSIVAGNRRSSSSSFPRDLQLGPDALLTINHSLIGEGDNLGTVAGDVGNLIGTVASPLDPRLGPLADNGGPTLTHALLSSSPAFDAGSNALAVDVNGQPLTTDQRGEVRGNGLSTRLGTVDIGAFEEESEANAEVESLIVTTGQDVADRFDGVISLREAIGFANASLAGVNNDGDADGDGFVADTVTFDASVFTGGDNSVIRLTQGELVISATLSIDGTSVGGVVITGDANDDDVTIGGSHITDVDASFGGEDETASDLLDDNSRVLNFSGSTGDLTLTGLTITGGRSTGLRDEGGGIFFGSDGELSLNNSTVSGNGTNGFGSVGGGIYTRSGTVSLVNSTLSGNSTSGRSSDGGGIYTRSGVVSLVNSTLSGNSTTGGGNFSTQSNGGGIYNRYGAVSLVNSTLSGNSTTGIGAGGGLATRSGNVSLLNSTLTGNSTLGLGGGLFVINSNDNPSLTIANSIVAGNFAGTAGNPNDLVSDPDGVLTINHSLIGVTDGLIINGGNNLTGTADLPLAPLLGPLADNGGPTLTHALLPGSPAIDAGSSVLALDENGDPLTADQRGNVRIQFGTVDIGAVEFGDSLLVGDANLDGDVNFLDISPFISLLSSTSFLDEADVNRDGDVNFLDISPFISLLSNGDASASPPILLGDANQDGFVNFQDIPPFVSLLSSNGFLDEADINRDGNVNFLDVSPFVSLLSSGGTAPSNLFANNLVTPATSNETIATSQAIVVEPPVSSAVAVVPVAEPELIAPVVSTIEAPLTTQTSDAIAKTAELVKHDSIEPVEIADTVEIVPASRYVPNQVAIESTSTVASQLSTAASLPLVVTPQFSQYVNLPSAPVRFSAVEYRLPERALLSSTKPLSLVGGSASFETRANDRQFFAIDSESDSQKTGAANLLDKAFASYEDELDLNVEFSY